MLKSHLGLYCHFQYILFSATRSKCWLQIPLSIFIRNDIMAKARVLILLLSWSLYYVLCDFLIDALKSPYIVGMALRIGTVLLMTVYLTISKKFCKFIFNTFSIYMILGVAFLTFLFDCIINIGLQFSSASSGERHVFRGDPIAPLQTILDYA